MSLYLRARFKDTNACVLLLTPLQLVIVFFFLSLNHVKSFRLVSHCHKGTETMCMYLVIEAKKVICEAWIISRKKVFPFRYSCFFFFFPFFFIRLQISFFGRVLIAMLCLSE